MGVIGTLLQPRAKKIGATHVSSPGGWLLAGAGGDQSVNAMRVNERTAMNIAVVKACIGNIAEDCAKLPLITYRRMARGRERVTNHPVYRLLHTEPNPEMSAFTFRELTIASALGWGNGYAEIERRRDGTPLALWPMVPSRTQVDRTRAGDLVYVYRSDGNGPDVTLLPDQVLHVHGLGWDGMQGFSPIRMAAEAIGLAAATERFGTSFFANGANPGGVLEHPARLSDPAYKRLKDSWNEKHAGPDNAHRLEILEEGMKYNALSIAPENAQFLETRGFQVEEICRWFRMPPHKVQKLDRSTNNNIEHQALEYVTDCLMGWLVRFEQECNRKLLGTGEVDLYVEHLVDALLRGDTKSRYEAHAIGRQWGWLSPNDVREKENMNPLPGDDGDLYLVPVNMTTPAKAKAAPAPGETPVKPAGAAPAPDAPKPDPAARAAALAAQARDAARSLEPVLAQAYRDVLRREADKVRKAMKQADPATEIASLYAAHGDHVRSILFPVAEAAGRLAAAIGPGQVDAAALVADLAAKHCGDSRQMIKLAIAQREVDAMLDAWHNVRADTEAAQHVDIIAAEISRALTQGGGHAGEAG